MSCKKLFRLTLLCSAISLSQSARALELSTFNTGLAHSHVAYADQRVPIVATVLKQNKADITCLQELWRPEDRELILKDPEIKAAYPYQYFVDSREPDAAQCKLGTLVPALACVQKNCTGGNTSYDTLDCAMLNCKDQVLNLGGNCFTCLSDQLPVNGALKAAGACLLRGPSKMFSGQTGIALLSKYPLENVDIKNLPTTMINRSVLTATVNTPEFGEVRLMCTHMQNNATTPYFGINGGWQAEQRLQMQELIAWSETFSQEKTILMGDFNTGPDGGAAYSSEIPTNFQFITDNHFRSPYLESGSAQCTWCGVENPLSGKEKVNHLIDHIFLRWPATQWPQSSHQRIGMELFDATVTKGKDVSKIKIPASDHYGLKATLSVAP